MSVYLNVKSAFKTSLISVENLAEAQNKQRSLCSINYITAGKNPNAGTVRLMIDLLKPRTNKVVKNFTTALHNSFTTCSKMLGRSRRTNIWPIPVAFSFNCISTPLAIFAKALPCVPTVRQCKHIMFLSHLSQNRNSPARGLKWGDHRKQRSGPRERGFGCPDCHSQHWFHFSRDTVGEQQPVPTCSEF